MNESLAKQLITLNPYEAAICADAVKTQLNSMVKMNESLAKQLHDLIKNYKISVADEITDTTRRVNLDLTNMENDINKLIDKNKNTQEKPNGIQG